MSLCPPLSLPPHTGFCFFTYESPEVSHQAVAALNGKELDGKELVVQHATAKKSLAVCISFNFFNLFSSTFSCPLFLS